jgi:GDP-mannose 6-dehydrogenase
MKVSVFGLGYVGTVGAACLVDHGIPVVSVDVNADKVAAVRNGEAPVVEPGLAELLKSAMKSGRLKATTSALEAVLSTDVSFIAVGTPSRPDGALDISTVLKVCEQIGAAVADKRKPHVVVLRSTVSPGTTAVCSEILQNHSKGTSISVAFNPEFLREGTAINDYNNPAYTIVGTTDHTAEMVLREVYANIAAPIIVTEPSVAEMIKLVSNAWHASKIAFANEIGRLGKSLHFDPWEVMEILTRDNKLNVSSAYMRPGFAFGGSCLPKDLRALMHFGRKENVDLPLLSSLNVSNQAQIDFALLEILATETRRIGIVGLAFKAGTDDLRESPALELAERLIGKGRDLCIYDPAVCHAKLVGANRRYIEGKLPHLSRLLVSSAAELLAHSELIVVTQHEPGFEDALARSKPNVPVIHLCCNRDESVRRALAVNGSRLASGASEDDAANPLQRPNANGLPY